MPKRQRSNDTSKVTNDACANPLSDARKDAVRKSSSNNKADQNARSLWHRKSGAGYHLFLSYYGSQPRGVVVDEKADFANNVGEIALSVAWKGIADGANCNSTVVKGGMSRAAKRRQKRKLKTGQEGMSNINDSSSTQPKRMSIPPSSSLNHKPSFQSTNGQVAPISSGFLEPVYHTSPSETICTCHINAIATHISTSFA